MASLPFTKYYSPSSVYGFTPTTEEIAKFKAIEFAIEPVYIYQPSWLKEKQLSLSEPHESPISNEEDDEEFPPLTF